MPEQIIMAKNSEVFERLCKLSEGEFRYLILFLGVDSSELSSEQSSLSIRANEVVRRFDAEIDRLDEAISIAKTRLRRKKVFYGGAIGTIVSGIALVWIFLYLQNRVYRGVVYDKESEDILSEVMVALFGTICHVKTDDMGVFTFKDCQDPGIRQLQYPKVSILYPGNEKPCPLIELQPPGSITYIALDSQCNSNSGPTAPSGWGRKRPVNKKQIKKIELKIDIPRKVDTTEIRAVTDKPDLFFGLLEQRILHDRYRISEWSRVPLSVPSPSIRSVFEPLTEDGQLLLAPTLQGDSRWRENCCRLISTISYLRREQRRVIRIGRSNEPSIEEEAEIIIDHLKAALNDKKILCPDSN